MNLKLLDHPIRQKIILALGNKPHGLKFEELRKKVDVLDRGKFGYHLRLLQPELLKKDSNDGKYYLTDIGIKFYGNLISGNIPLKIELKEFRTKFSNLTCQVCGHQGLRFETNGIKFRLICPRSDCKNILIMWHLKPRNWQEIDLTPIEVAERSWKNFVHCFRYLFDSLCPKCQADIIEERFFDKIWMFRFLCSHCDFQLISPFTCLLEHPINRDLTQQLAELSLRRNTRSKITLYRTDKQISIMKIKRVDSPEIIVKFDNIDKNYKLVQLSKERLKKLQPKKIE